MISCYTFTLITFFLMCVALPQSFLKFKIFAADHVTFMIFLSIIYIFTETLVIFFFVGTGVSVKEYTQQHNLDHSFHKRSIAIKRKVYPPLLLNMLFMVIIFVLVGAVDTYRFPLWAYALMFAGCIAHYVKIKVLQNTCFRENTQIILDMSGIKHQLS